MVNIEKPFTCDRAYVSMALRIGFDYILCTVFIISDRFSIRKSILIDINWLEERTVLDFNRFMGFTRMFDEKL